MDEVVIDCVVWFVVEIEVGNSGRWYCFDFSCGWVDCLILCVGLLWLCWCGGGIFGFEVVNNVYERIMIM